MEPGTIATIDFENILFKFWCDHGKDNRTADKLASDFIDFAANDEFFWGEEENVVKLYMAYAQDETTEGNASYSSRSTYPLTFSHTWELIFAKAGMDYKKVKEAVMLGGML